MDSKAESRTQRLVATRVATLPAGTYTDPGQTGLQLRVREKASGSSRTWLLRFKFKGEETRIVLGHFPQTNLDSARGEARKFREIASQGIDPRRAKSRRREPSILPTTSAASMAAEHTIEHLANEFMERYVKPHRRCPEYVQAILDRDVLPDWRGRDARTIKPREVIDLLDKIVDRGSRVMANRTAAVIDQLFRFGIHRAILDDSPVKLLVRPGGKERPRERVLSDEELKSFLQNPRACTRFERLQRIIMILLLTGQRRGELAKSKWNDISFKAKTWTIPDANSKTGRGHVVPLSDWAVDEFNALRREAEGSKWVLPAPDREQPIDAKQLTRSLAKCAKRFRERGIKKFTLHDLRRTCRTGLAALKVEPHVAERVLNHTQPGVAGVYDRHAYLHEKRDALEKWATHLRGLSPP